MSVSSFLVRETKTIFNTYQPVRTEASGIKDIADGIANLVYSSLWRLIDSNDLGTGTPVATEAIKISGVMVAQGVIKLTFPIIFSAGYLLSRYYR